jgi:hypothetical protein
VGAVDIGQVNTRLLAVFKEIVMTNMNIMIERTSQQGTLLGHHLLIACG